MQVLPSHLQFRLRLRDHCFAQLWVGYLVPVPVGLLGVFAPFVLANFDRRHAQQVV